MTFSIDKFDIEVISAAKKYGSLFARVAFFVVFFWFGALKVIGASPANPLVGSLLTVTIPFITLDQFVVGFGLFEMLIGAAFLIRGWERVLIPFFLLHMTTTLMPLIFLTEITWQAPWVPTLEGQYIIKNIVLLALATALVGQMRPLNGKAK